MSSRGAPSPLLPLPTPSACEVEASVVDSSVVVVGVVLLIVHVVMRLVEVIRRSSYCPGTFWYSLGHERLLWPQWRNE